ncbi:MAG: dipeptide epimerase [Pseudomonadota bacterium]
MARFTVEIVKWPVRRPFRIAYHTFYHRDLLRVTLSDGKHTGRGEAGGHPHLESIEAAQARLLALAPDIETGMDRYAALLALPPGPARTALDAALWDLEAKRAGQRVWELAGLPAPAPIETAYTVGIAPLAQMVSEAQERSDFRLLKLKVDSESGFELLQAIAAARPDAEFIIDANEAWSLDRLAEFVDRAAGLRVQLIEQPLPREADAPLETFDSPIPLAADESFHSAPDIERLCDLYDVINVKLDKIGGLTAALQAAKLARDAGMELMVGCNGGTSLGIAPAYCFGLLCRYVDLDSPLLLAQDVDDALSYEMGRVLPPDPNLWG